MLIAIKNLRKRRANTGYALNVPEFCLNQADKVLLSGASGSGKSTLLDILGLVLKFDEAEEYSLYATAQTPVNVAALWRSANLAALGGLRRHFGYVLQTGGLLPYLSARQNILLALQTQVGGQAEWLPELAERLGIAKLLNKLPARLSVGERQRVAIARAVINKPLVILADEPTAALDPAHARAVMDLFTSLVDDMKLTLVLVSHDAGLLAGREGFRRFNIEQAEASGEASVREV